MYIFCNKYVIYNINTNIKSMINTHFEIVVCIDQYPLGFVLRVKIPRSEILLHQVRSK